MPTTPRRLLGALILILTVGMLSCVAAVKPLIPDIDRVIQSGPVPDMSSPNVAAAATARTLPEFRQNAATVGHPIAAERPADA